MNSKQRDYPAMAGFSPLTGLKSAWLRVLLDATNEMESAQRRRGNSFGILVRDDRHAIAYRLARRRKDRAYLSLTGWPFGCPLLAERFDKDGYQDTTADEFAAWWGRWWQDGRELRPLREKLDAIVEREDLAWHGG